MKKRNVYTRKLDEQAKVFALSSGKKYSSIFRLTVFLKENVNSEKLSEALILALNKYQAFKVKMKKSFYRYFLEENEKNPIIKEECKTDFTKINTKENNDYLFKVTYFENRVDVQFFHALTDGNGGMKFVKEIIYNYIKLQNPDKFEEVNNSIQIIKDSENAYKNAYKNFNDKIDSLRKAYHITGEMLSDNKTEVNHLNIDLDLLKNCSKEKNATLSIYIISMIAYSIYETSYLKSNGKKPINLNIPIDLNKYFETETISNFFSYITIDLHLKRSRYYTFENILDMVKKQFEIKLKLEYFMSNIASNIRKMNSVYIKMIPLAIKKIGFLIGSKSVKKKFTMTISNIGKIDIDSEFKEYIDKVYVTLVPDWAEKIKCGICSYDNNLIVTFGTKLKENFVENKFIELLKENNISYKIDGNMLEVGV